jgi:hypothetical protein
VAVPSIDLAAVPVSRGALPCVPPAPPRPSAGADGLLRDTHGAVTIHPELRRQSTHRRARSSRVEVERFRAIEPDATLELRIQHGERRWHTDLFVELDRTFKPSKNVDKFERYDHMPAGWLLHKDRYTKYLADSLSL